MGNLKGPSPFQVLEHAVVNTKDLALLPQNSWSYFCRLPGATQRNEIRILSKHLRIVNPAPNLFPGRTTKRRPQTCRLDTKVAPAFLQRYAV